MEGKLERSGCEIFGVAFRGLFPGRVTSCERGARGGTDGAVPVSLFSRSDSAKSCLMISAFCRFSAFWGPWANTLVRIAHTTSAVATPIKGMLIICADPQRECSEQSVARIVRELN